MPAQTEGPSIDICAVERNRCFRLDRKSRAAEAKRHDMIASKKECVLGEREKGFAWSGVSLQIIARRRSNGDIIAVVVIVLILESGRTLRCEFAR
jgi:hypothetical protein